MVFPNLLLSLLLAISSPALCDPEPHIAVHGDLNHHHWKIGSYAIDGRQWIPIGGMPVPHLFFNNGKITGILECGTLAGSYSFPGNDMHISVALSDDTDSCTSEQRARNELVVKALNGVTRLSTGWETFPDLQNDDHTIEVGLEPENPGADLAEVDNSFWNIAQLPITREPLTEVKVRISGTTIMMYRSDCAIGIPFRYMLAGLKFYPPFTTTGGCPLAGDFQSALHQAAAYSTSGNDLSMTDAKGKTILRLQRLHPDGLEYIE